jgi:hypothetical protein
MDHPRPWLKYVDANDLVSSTMTFDGVDVESPTAEKLGSVDGFVVDTALARPYYLVVDSGGWFKSKRFLVPIGHVSYDAGRRRFIADVTKERVHRFPGFDRDEFEQLSDDELRLMDEQIVASCCPSEKIDRTASAARFEQWTHYRSPSWWSADFYRPDRVEGNMRDMSATAPGASMPSRDRVRAEHDKLHEHEHDEEGELVTAYGGDVSPHAGGRAQPGDVLGTETGGERTYLGDTSEDENERRRDAERDAAKSTKK